jgi:hypothetical protein
MNGIANANRTKTVLIILLALVAPCVCATPLIALAALPQEIAREVGVPLMLGLICCAVPLLALFVLGWIGLDLLRARQVSGRLAEELGWRPLTPAEKPINRWHGGQHRRQVMAFKTTISSARSWQGSGYTVSYHAGLRIVTAVNNPRLIEVGLQRRAADRSPTTSFAQAFPGGENDDQLSARSQQALIDFVAKGYPTGLRGRVYRANSGTRNLLLQARARVPATILPPEILPEAAIVLIHNYPDATAVTTAEFRELLDELDAIAAALEQA